MHELQYGDILTFTNQADASDNVIAPVILALEHTVWADLRSYTNEDFWEPNGFGQAEVMLTSSESAAPIRGEVPFASVCRCAEGIVRQVFRQRGTGNEVGITFPLSAFSVSPFCTYREAWLAENPGTPGWMPRPFSHHRKVALKPCSHSP